MHVERVNGALGAVVGGVDLERVDDAGFEQLRDALMEHQVLFLRDQDLSDEGHRKLAYRFGTPSVYPLSRLAGQTEFLHHIEDSEKSPPKADGWHMDITWVDRPPDVAVLAAEVVPAYGGDTMWADLYGAWEQLSPTVQEMLRPLRVCHALDDEFWRHVALDDPERERRLRKAFPGVVHPLVRDHPVTGRTLLNLGGYFMDSIVGMTPKESSWLLSWLNARVDDPNLQLRWSWRVGDVALWDERSVVHRALSDHFPQHRRMRRCTVDVW